ncbi:DinB family protein [Brucella grignonensis]|uniref:DinB superfamily protein n=1 Tax=Brucella grignonensis TaxID=94627 RepID=A0A256G399_9HYPH|nr:DinB family protein [Brucella grignonensis]NKB84545.1 damage-inducible protein DinB [Brucella grignonensis]OYR21496.1 dinB superfamily protein [Brucella grignonensis]
MQNTFAMLAEYNDWADRMLFDAIRKLPERAPSKPLKTLFGSIIGTLNHNYQVDMIWRAHLLGEKHGFTTRRDILYPDFDAIVEKQFEINEWYVMWAKSQSAESLSEVLNFKFVSGVTGRMTREGMFLHIINHKTYHRGWIAQMFFDFDVNPPETDLCVYLCEN